MASSGTVLQAFEHDGRPEWTSDTILHAGWGGPSIADLDGDGAPEILIGRQVLNHEGTLLDFLSLVEVADFREAMSERSDEYEIAFVEGCVSRADEVARLRRSRRNARTLVALGSCACLGGVPRMRNRVPRQDLLPGGICGEGPGPPEPVRALDEVVSVDLKVHGCPFPKEELEKVKSQSSSSG